MKRIIRSAVIIDPHGPHHQQKKDLLIENDRIVRIADNIDGDAEEFTAENLHVSLGWFDMRVNFCDPGFEHREDICTGLQAARKGGFTGVGLVPSTAPPLSTRSQIDYVRNQARGSSIELYPYGTISADRNGEQLAELYDMQRSGAVAFTDHKRAMVNASLMSTALLYAKNFDGLIMSFPHEASMCHRGQMHEGEVSTRLGLKGLPALAEELMVARDLYLCEYNDARIHFTGISTRSGVDLIRQAKKRGLKVSCDVYAHNLVLTDDALVDFDQQKKVLPPFRDEDHRQALIEGLKDGTIDAICSDHSPQDVEQKHTEFEHAAFGIINLESCFGLLNKVLHRELEISEIILKIAKQPRKLLGLETPLIEENAPANLTFFNPDAEWTFEHSDIRSKSANTPFIGTVLKGRALAVYNQGRLEPCS